MIEAKVSPFKSLRLDGIHELVQSPGPCISLLLPPYRPGEQAPDPERHEIYDAAYARYRELYFALKPIFQNSVRAQSAVSV